MATTGAEVNILIEADSLLMAEDSLNKSIHLVGIKLSLCNQAAQTNPDQFFKYVGLLDMWLLNVGINLMCHIRVMVFLKHLLCFMSLILMVRNDFRILELLLILPLQRLYFKLLHNIMVLRM